ncbi:MAG TPA: hypothetical protein VFF69_05030, partial [Phycisphaerales bacterium]|nr:hypothetical protein [Phycisphaerales bacterium]
MHSPSMKQILAEAALPPRLTKRIRRLARRTRLLTRERARVAEMLSAESAQRLAAGESEQAILASLRPVARTARRLRREILRAAPLRRIAWGSLTWIKRSILASLLATLLAYPYLFWRFHSPEPTIARNLAAEYNATIDAIPPESRAAALYREVAEALEPVDEEAAPDFAAAWPSIRPGEALWAEACAYLDRNQDAVALIRAAAAKPFAGYRLSTVPPIDSAAIELDPGDHWNGNPFWLALCIEPLAQYRSFGRILAADARCAAERAEPERACEDVLGVLNLARHAEEGRSVIGDLVGIAIRVGAFELLTELVTEHPGLLEEAALVRLAVAVGTTIPDDRPKLDLEI